MAFLFNRSNRPKTPQELVRTVRESIARLDVPSEKKRAVEEITKCLNSMKSILIGDGGYQIIVIDCRNRSDSRAGGSVVTRDLYL